MKIKELHCYECAAFTSEVRGRVPEVPGQVSHGECHLKAPSPNIRPDVPTQWPIVPAGGWCLEFRPAITLNESASELPPVVEAPPSDGSATCAGEIFESSSLPVPKEKKRKKKGEG